MSLIALTDRVHTGRSMARTLLLLVAVTGAIIVGLLAMHSLNTHTATDTSHQTTATASATTDWIAACLPRAWPGRAMCLPAPRARRSAAGSSR